MVCLLDILPSRDIMFPPEVQAVIDHHKRHINVLKTQLRNTNDVPLQNRIQMEIDALTKEIQTEKDEYKQRLVDEQPSDGTELLTLMKALQDGKVNKT